MRFAPVVAVFVLAAAVAPAILTVSVAQGGDGGNATDGNQTAPPAGDGNATAPPPSDGAPGAPTEAPARPTLTVPVFLKDSQCTGSSFCIEFARGVSDLNLPPGAEVTFQVTNLGGSEHDLTFTTVLDSKTPLLGPGETHDLTVTLPASGRIDFICSVPGHEALGMRGSIVVGGAAADEEKEIVDYGVKYWAYWVGIISFIIMFAVLFVLYFVFRYGETPQALDHRTGRTEKAVAAVGGHAVVHESNAGLWMALLMGVIFTLLLIIAVILGGGK